MKTLKYKGYSATVEFDSEAMLFHGHVVDLKDVITFQSQDAAKLEEEFHISVDTYIEFCEELGQDPEKPYSGIFNLRIPPELHHRAHVRAAEENMSINALAAYAIERLIAIDQKTEGESFIQQYWGKISLLELPFTEKCKPDSTIFSSYLETSADVIKKAENYFKKPEAIRRNIDAEIPAA